MTDHPYDPNPSLGTAWCPECRRTRGIVDEFEGTAMTAHGETGQWVTALECGHEARGPEHVTGPAPGAPYAGPDAAVAPDLRPASIRGARERQAQVNVGTWDPWA